MGNIDRRTFLLTSGRWLLLAGLTPLVSGCGRVLSWSESQGGSPEPFGAISESVSSTSVSVADAVPPSTATAPGFDSTTSSTSQPTAGVAPDLVVVKGEAPDLNVRAAILRLGGMERFVKRDAKVVIKPNVLTGRPPEYATTTNPLVVSALVRMCLEAGAAEVTVLDYPTSSPRAAFKESGIAQATEEAGGRLKYLEDRHFERMEIPEGRSITSWPFVTDVFEADTFINVPIGKTHGMAGLTLAMKNLMGVMGDPRGRIHIDFPQKITDVNTLIKPHLVVLDAYRILVRNGPTGGNLDDVEMPKTVVVGTSQTAVDAYGATLMGWKPTDLPSLVEAAGRGLGEIDLSKLRIEQATA
jgi:uncharacterized protein (DUF362 family)